jgi:ribosomal-protein-serine acetyltransferase
MKDRAVPVELTPLIGRAVAGLERHHETRMRVELRHLRESDAEAFNAAVHASVRELRPWMPWAAEEPRPLQERLELIRRWERERVYGGDRSFGIFLDGAVAGACGLHGRIGEGGLEIGYWVRSDLTGRGIATEAARRLCEIAFEDPAVDRVEIHHDRANAASGRIPAKLGFTRVGENHVAPEAPGEDGVEIVWRLARPSG